MSAKREQIINAALDEFAEVGVNNTSLASIADRANLEVQIVRALFVDTETLLNELMRQETEPMVSAIALAVDKIDDPKELLRKSLKIFDQWMLDHKQMVAIWVRCSQERATALSSFYQNSLLPSEFFERLQQLIDKGQVRCNDLFVLSILFDSLIAFPHMMRTALELMCSDQTVEQVFNQRFEAMIDLLEHGLYTN